MEHLEPSNERRAQIALAALIAAYAAAYGALSLLRFHTFHSQFDLPFYVRLVWGMGHGEFDLPMVGAPHFLGLHLEPILWPFAALSATGVPVAPLLLVTQAMAVALLAWPAYRLGRRHLGGPTAGMAAAFAALLYPTVTVSTLHAFHPGTLALAPLLGVVDALDERRTRRAVLLGLLALACREDIALQLAVICAVAALRLTGPARIVSLAAAAALALYFTVYIVAVQPRFAPAFSSYGAHFTGGAKMGATGRDVLFGLLAEPTETARQILAPSRLVYFWTLLWPVAALAILAPGTLAAALPIAAINLLSDFPRVRTIEAHYATTIVPFVVGAAIIGAGVAGRFFARRVTAVPTWRARLSLLPLAALLCCSMAAHIAHGASPLALTGDRFAIALFRDDADAPAIRKRLATIPARVSVSAQPGVLAHLAERPRPMCLKYYDDGLGVEVELP